MPATTTFLNRVPARCMPPTKRHRPAIWENMLGTVFACNPSGQVKFFDYDYDGAVAWAGLTSDSDPRVAKVPAGVRYVSDGTVAPRAGKVALWAKR